MDSIEYDNVLQSLRESNNDNDLQRKLDHLELKYGLNHIRYYKGLYCQFTFEINRNSESIFMPDATWWNLVKVDDVTRAKEFEKLDELSEYRTNLKRLSNNWIYTKHEIFD